MTQIKIEEKPYSTTEYTAGEYTDKNGIPHSFIIVVSTNDNTIDRFHIQWDGDAPHKWENVEEKIKKQFYGK